MATTTALDPQARHRQLLMSGVLRAGRVDLPRRGPVEDHAEPRGLDPQDRHQFMARVDVVDDEVTQAVAAGIARYESRAWDPQEHPRIPTGHKGGGRFRKLADRIFEALQQWEKGEGPDDPFADVLDADPVKRREQIRRLAKDRGLTLRRGASYEEIAKAVLDNIRGGVKAKRQEKKDTLRLVPEGKPKGLDPTKLSGPAGPDRPQVLDRDGVRRDIMVIASKDGKRVVVSTVDSTTGERTEDVTRQPDFASLRQWAVDNDYPDLAKWVDKHVPADKMGGEKKAPAATMTVFDEEQQKFREIPRKEAIEGYQRYIKATFRPGEPAMGVAQERLVKMAKGEDVGGIPYIPKPSAKKVAPKPDGGLTADVDTLRQLGDAEAIRDELDLKKVPELKELAGHLGVAKSGRKRDLVDRLVDSIGPSGAAKPSVPDDGLDVLEDHQLKSLASEFEIPNARTLSRQTLLRRLRAEGAQSPYLRETAPSATGAVVSGRMSDKPILPNRWGTGQAGEVHYHEDGAIGVALQRMGDDSRLDVDGEPLANVLGRLATDGVRGRKTSQQVLDDLKVLRDRMPEGSAARRALDDAVQTIDAPPRDPLPLPDGTPAPIRELMEAFSRIPLARRTTPVRGERERPSEMDLLAEVVALWRAGESSPLSLIHGRGDESVGIAGLRNRHHESVEGKFELDRAVDKAVADLEVIFRDPARRDELKPPGAPATPPGTRAPEGRRFGDFESAKAFLADHYGGWREGLTRDQESGLALYQSPAYAVMNGLLRDADPDDIEADVDVTPDLVARARKANRNLHSAIDSAPPLVEPVVVYRSFDADQYGDLAPGREIVDPAFVSTSLTEVDAGGGIAGRGRRPAVATVRLPEGTRAAGGSARELILAPGSRFRVTGVSRRGGTIRVDMELLPAAAVPTGRPATAARAATTLDRLAADLAQIPDADRRVGGVATPNELVAQWRRQLDSGELTPDALPELFERMTVRYSTAEGDPVGAAFAKAAGDLRTPDIDVAATLAGFAGLTVRQKRARLRALGLPEDQIDQLVPTASKTRKVTRSADDDPDDEDVEPDEDSEDDDDDPDDEDEDDFEILYPAGEAARAADPEALHHYWTKGAGLKRWVGHPHPWTTLYRHLRKYVGSARAKRMAGEWFIEVFGFAAGSDKNRVMHGKPPRGKLVGPG